MFKKIKNRYRRANLAKRGVGIELSCQHEVYGSGGGSWTLSPDHINTDSVIYSFGVGRDLSLDIDLVTRHDATVHAFDPTPESMRWVEEQSLPEKLVFHDYGIAESDGEIEFYAPRRATSAHFTPVKRYHADRGERISAQVKSISTIMQELGHDRIDLLKMDIEGGEYSVIEDIVARNLPIGQMLVEFHHMYETIPLEKTIQAVEQLRSQGLRVFAISERSYEISMLNPDI